MPWRIGTFAVLVLAGTAAGCGSSAPARPATGRSTRAITRPARPAATTVTTALRQTTPTRGRSAAFITRDTIAIYLAGQYADRTHQNVLLSPLHFCQGPLRHLTCVLVDARRHMVRYALDAAAGRYDARLLPHSPAPPAYAPSRIRGSYILPRRSR